MTHRLIGLLVTLAILVAPLAAHAQLPAKVPRIGILVTSGGRQSCSSPA